MSSLRARLGLGVLAVVSGCSSPELADTALPDSGAPLGVAEEDGLAVRLASAERGFGAVPGGFSARNRAWGLDARVLPEGVRLEGPRGGLSLQFVAWGREDALDGVETVAPALGDCTSQLDPAGDCLRRVELARGPVLEWWANGAAGLQQGWELLERPDGDGPLTLAVAVSGASLAPGQGEDVVWLEDEGGGLWRYADALAWDADGEPLEAWLEVEEDLIQVRVDDRGARWPIFVDPTTTSADASWAGSATEALGTALAGRGDLNGDGYDDLAIGAPGASAGAGAVYVFYGSASGPASSADLTLSGPAAGAAFGTSVAMDGDANGDGYDDLVVGAPSATVSAAADGAVYVYAGSASGLSATPLSTLTGSASAGAAFGWSVDLAGDVNGDGYDDVLVGEPLYSTSTGRAWVFAGTSAGPSTASYQRFTGAATNQLFGWSVSGGGDVAADGLADIAVGVPGYEGSTTTDNGRAISYNGASTFFTSAPSAARTLTFSGSSTNNYQYGYAVSLEQSIDDDVYADLLVGAPYGASTKTGRLYVYYSSGTSLPTGASTNMNGPEANSGYGSAIAALGDINGDGMGDLAVGAPYYSSNAGYVAVLEGTASTISSADVSNTFSGSGSEKLGMGLGGAGDVNGDGYADLLIGGPSADGGAGQASLHYGGLDADGDGYLSNAPAVGKDCDDTNAAINPGASEVCDADGTDEDCDGLTDDDDGSVTGRSTWYLDADGDGYGDPTMTDEACVQPTGYVANADDCDDGDEHVNPAAGEACDAGDTDEDCDGLADDADSEASGKSTYYEDIDGDGYGNAASTTEACDLPADFATNDDDCDDGDASIKPGGAELCDAADADEDCDGLADDADPSVSGLSTWYADEDGDGYGDAASTSAACDLPSGYVANDDDCDDASASIKPGGAEVCDAANTDEDCDGLADDADSSASGKSTWYADDDGDTYGDAASTSAACDLPSGYVTNDDDCDDDSASVKPGGMEICDAANTDEDCDGLADDADSSATGKSTWYADDDGDTYGDAASTSAACDLPSGYVTNDDDCDDASASIKPGGTEICDDADVDEDCDGLADDADSSASGFSTWYRDADGDSYGDVETTREACALPSGYVANDDDCDDASASIKPGGTEICDAANEDEDCDGAADDADASATGKSTWYADDDGDTYGDAASTTAACDLPHGYVANDDDCDDGSASIKPGGTEICDDADTDEDCDGLADDADSAATGGSTWYADEDGDGFGDDASTTSACDLPSGFVANNDDCDDTSGAISPAGSEACDADDTDEDCDGLADDDDDDASGESTWYRDADTDGYGDPASTTSACDLPSGYVANEEDCDDSSSLVSPAATERCDADDTDEDCDGLADDADGSATGQTSWYADADLDGWGDSDVSTEACDLPAGYVANADDCDDDRDDVRPDGVEVCDDDDTDEDCDGWADDDDSDPTELLTWYADEDADDYGDPASTTEACDLPAGYVANADDCDDGSDDYHPGADETDCSDPNDYNCDGSVGYEDLDGDDWAACEECDDGDGAINPAADEIAGDEVDQDCDGAEICFDDDDGDAWLDDSGDTRVSEDLDCLDAYEGSLSTPTGDCDDADATTHPEADELCDELDNDCDAAVDEELATSIWYSDADGDGYGDPESSVESCGEPAGAVSNGDDCDDGADAVYPGATEIPDDDIDQDCDGADSTTPDDTGDTGDTAGGDDTGGEETGEDTGGGKDDGCGCGTAPRGGTGALVFLAAGLALSRRRRR